MSSEIYAAAKEKADDMAKCLKIEDGFEIRKMTCEYVKKAMVKEGQEIVDTLNIMGGDFHTAVLEGMLEGIQTSHRHLQGEFWLVMLKLIKKYGETDRYDGRNQFAVKMCQRMAEAGEKY